MMHRELSIVMPTYNEEGCIEKVVREWTAAAAAATSSFEVVVVDDGSRDATGAILDRLASQIPGLRIIHQANAGHGPALRRAFQEARAEWVFHVDSDDQFDPGDLGKLWNLRSAYDYLCGYRAERHDPFHRKVVSGLLRLLNWLLFGLDVRDANIPFKLIRRAALAELLALVPSGALTPSILMSVAAKRRFRFVEIPVRHYARATGRSFLVRLSLLKACFRSAAELRSFRAVLK